MLASAPLPVREEIADRAETEGVEALDLARREDIAGAAREPPHHALPLLELLQAHDGVEDALVGAEGEERPLDDALDQPVAVGIPMLEDLADHPPAVAILSRVETGLPVDVAQRPSLVAHDELHGDEMVVGVDVTREVREVPVCEGLLALGLRRLGDLPADGPAVAMRVEAARILLPHDDVGGHAAVEIREAVLAENFLKRRPQDAKGRENLRPVDEVGDRTPGVRVGRPDEHEERD